MNSSKLIIPHVGIGTWAFGGDYWGKQKHSDSVKTIHSAVREGFTLFDTAPVYGKGRSEQLLGQQLYKNRSEYIISTKCFLKPENQFIKSLETSLKRLNTDYIDIFFIHWPSSIIDSRPIVELLEKQREIGKIKYIGLSNFNKKQLKAASEAGKVDIVQNAFNLFWQKDADYFEYCKKNNIATQAYSILAQGLLTGKFNRINPYNRTDMRYKMSLFNDNNIKFIYNSLNKIEEIARREKSSIYELIISWTLSKNKLDSIIVGCRNRNQVEQLSSAVTKKISPEAINQLDALSSEISQYIISGDNIFNHFY